MNKPHFILKLLFLLMSSFFLISCKESQEQFTQRFFNECEANLPDSTQSYICECALQTMTKDGGISALQKSEKNSSEEKSFLKLKQIAISQCQLSQHIFSQCEKSSSDMDPNIIFPFCSCMANDLVTSFSDELLFSLTSSNNLSSASFDSELIEQNAKICLSKALSSR